MIIGQEHIVKELTVLAAKVLEGENFAILLRAPSGYGKTALISFFKSLISSKDNRVDTIRINERYKPSYNKVIVVDEVHRYKYFEDFYLSIDMKVNTFLFASNMSGNLPEAFRNRCINLYLNHYTLEEIQEIILRNFNFLTPDAAKVVAQAGRLNPRIAKQIATRLRNFYRGNTKWDEAQVKDVLSFIKISLDGMNEADRIYLSALKDVKRASLNNILALTGLDRETVLDEIEPFLLKKKLIRITPKGREIVDDVDY